MNWKDAPDSIGDWLWIRIKSCDCCIDECGTAFLYRYKRDGIKDITINNLYCSWEGTFPKYLDDNGYPKYPMKWLKIELPIPIRYLDEQTTAGNNC